MRSTDPTYRLSRAAALLGVSDDTVRRWVDAGRVEAHTSDDGVKVIPGAALAALAQELAAEQHVVPTGGTSARNRLPGIVTRVLRDGVMAQVEMQAGPFRLVSLMTREAADELDLQVGSVAIASVKATTVAVDLPRA